MKTKMFKVLLFSILLALLLTVASPPQKIYADVNHCGTLSANETWSASANVHVVTCDITIPVSVTLTIEAGAIIKFQNNTQINVNGKLVAQGTAVNPIYFTSYFDDTIGGDTDGAPTAGAMGDWGHILFNSGSDDTSLITRVIIRYSGDDAGFTPNDGAIRLNNASPDLSYITFSNNYINGVEIVGGTWQSDTWDNTTIIYLVNGDVTIPAANTLTINPGMKIKLADNTDIRVDGKLVVPGLSANPIYFSSYKDDTLCGTDAANNDNICDTRNDGSTAGAMGDWGHILFNSGSDDTSLITRVIIRYSGDDAGFTPNDGAIRLNNASPDLSYITFSNNYINAVQIQGNISWQTDIWDNTTVIYVVEGGDITIPAANTLTINPGMKIKLTPSTSFNVDGRFVVPGTSGNPVYFSSYLDDTLCGLNANDQPVVCDSHNDGPSVGAIGNWGNIVFNSGSDDTSTIRQLVIRFAGNDGGGLNDGAIRLISASPTISSTQIVNNYQGIEALSDSTPTLICNDIYNNTNFGIYNDLPTTIRVAAKGHWWGSALGPTHSGNPGGNGQLVSDGVDYTPWATLPCTTPIITYFISGRVTDSSNNPVSGVLVSTGPSGSATTNATGYYTITNLITGTYTLIPSASDYTFSPTSRTVSVPPDATGQNFTASLKPPGTPTLLSATAISQTQINLTWQDNSSTESEFHIERSPNGNTGWTEIATVGANKANYSNTGLNCSTTYFYRVRAHRHSDGKFSGYSNVLGAKTHPCSPSNLAIPGVSKTQINLTWKDNSPDELEFHIERSPNGNTGWIEIAKVGANVTNYSNTGLNCSTTYFYRVRAHRHSDGKFSGYSNVVSTRTYPCSPSNLVAIAVSQTQINLTWRDTSPDESEFHIERALNMNTGWTEIAKVGANVIRYNDTGLNDGTLYYYRVRAHRHTDNTSTYSNVASALDSVQ